MNRDARDYKQFFRGLTREEMQEFTKQFGGEPSQTADQLIDWVKTSAQEASVCDAIQKVFGVTIPTAAERQEELARATTDATIKSADAADRSAREAAEANKTAKAAHRTAHLTMIYTAITAVVALAAFVLSIIAMCK